MERGTTKKLKDVADLISGRDLDTDKFNSEGKGLPYITGATNFKNGAVEISRWTEYPCVYSDTTDILITCKGTVGLIAENKIGSCHIARQIMAIRPNTKAINTKYLKYVLESNVQELRYNARSMIPGISRENLLSIIIPLPPVEEQQHIVNVLDTISGIIEKRKQQIAKLDELEKSLFIEMFGDPVTNPMGWIKKSFKEISSLRQGLQIPISSRKKTKTNNSLEYITVQYLNGNKAVEYIENPKSSVICNPEDVLMTRTGNTGQVITGVHGVFHNNFFCIDYNRKVLNRLYLVFFLNNNNIQVEIRKRAGTSTIPDLNHSDFYKIKIPIPSIELQECFSKKVEKIAKIKKDLESGLESIYSVYYALMQRYFR